METHDLENEKRRMILSLESFRTSANDTDVSPDATERADVAASHSLLSQRSARDDGEGERLEHRVSLLKEELRVAQATNELLEEEVKRLEQRALSAIAEVGALRRYIEQNQAEPSEDENGCACAGMISADHFNARRAEEVESLLAKALSDSESEIARLCKALQTLETRIGVA